MNTPQLADSLRAAVLQAAIKGELTERSSENARNLLLRIQNEKQALQAKGSLKKTKAPTPTLAPVTADEVPFDIPENWVWVRLGDYLQFIDYRGMTPQKIENGVRLITAANIKKGFFDNSTAAYISEDEYQQRKSRGVTELGDVLFTTEAPLGHCCLNPFEKASCGQRIITFKPFVKTDYVNQFIVYVINSAFFQKAIHDNKSGVTAKGIKAATLKTLPIPLPPLAEQQAIAEKLTRLLAEIDRLKAEEQSLASLQKAYPQTLRASVLAAAVRGDLNERSQEHARDLLLQIQNEKQALQAKGSLKKTKALPPVGANEVPFEIPENWVWVRLGEIVQVNPRNQAEDETEAGFVPMTLLNDGFRNSFTFETRPWQEIKKGFTHFSDGDVVIAKITPCFQNRKSAVINGLPNKIGAGTTELHVLRPYGASVLPEYLLFIAKSAAFINDGMANFTGTAGQQRISSDFVKNYLIPLPPLAEQQAIVEKLNRLLAEIDALENA